MSEQEDNKRTDIYGFRVNLHQKPIDAPFSNKWTDKLSKSKAITTSARKVLFLMLIGIVLLATVGIYLLTNMRRASFMAVPTIVICLGLSLLIRQFILINRASGTLLVESFSLLIQLIMAHRVHKGKMKHLRNVGIQKIDADGLIHFVDGTLGYLFQLDGNNSPTSFPSDKKKENELSRNYQNGRKTTTTMTTYSSSQLQDAGPQLLNMKRESRECNDKRIEAVIDLQYLNTKENIDKVQPTIVQFNCISEVNRTALADAVNRLYEYTDKNLFYSCVLQDGDQATHFYRELYGLK